MKGIKEFYEVLSKDVEMQKRVKNAIGDIPKNDEAAFPAAIEFAAKEGYTFTVDEAKTFFAEKAKSELSDKQLEDVTGGLIIKINCFLVSEMEKYKSVTGKYE